MLPAVVVNARGIPTYYLRQFLFTAEHGTGSHSEQFSANWYRTVILLHSRCRYKTTYKTSAEKVPAALAIAIDY